MPFIGITGHQAIEAKTAKAIEAMMLRRLRMLQPVTGLSSLAAGADQMFARCVMETGGKLVVVLPSQNYETTLQGSDRDLFLRLLRKAERSVQLPYGAPSEEAFFAAGKEIVDMCDILFAVWDGKPPGGVGGTGDVVKYAKKRGKPTEVFWPAWGSR